VEAWCRIDSGIESSDRRHLSGEIRVSPKAACWGYGHRSTHATHAIRGNHAELRGAALG
jgi:hypothetical protein